MIQAEEAEERPARLRSYARWLVVGAGGEIFQHKQTKLEEPHAALPKEKEKNDDFIEQNTQTKIPNHVNTAKSGVSSMRGDVISSKNV